MVGGRLRIAGIGATCCLLFAGLTVLHETGFVGVTKKSGTIGCVCHNPTPADSVMVWVSGPESVRIGTRYLFTLSMKGGPAVAGGFDLAAGSGTLAVADDSTHIDGVELTHSSPRVFRGDTVQWSFYYTPPVTGSFDTLFSVGNSVNLNGIPSGDRWNFGADYIVLVQPDTTLGVTEEDRLRRFRLYQNYPNPFNPVTHVSFTLAHPSHVSLTVIDLLGREVAVLLDERMSAGAHEVVWNGGTSPSGVYFCRFQSGAGVQVGKMILLK